MELIQKKFPGREQEIKFLWNMIPENNHSTKRMRPGSFLLCGSPATGKTAILRHILDSKHIRYIFQNCCECDDLPTLYTLILMELFERFEHLGSIRTFWEFITCFQRADSAIRGIRFIILKNLESLGSTVYEQFSAFQTYLSDNGWNLRMVFISNDGVSVEDMDVNVYYIEFPQYNQEQLRSILLLKRLDYPDQLYQSFLNVFLPSVYNNQRDLRALLRLVDFLFPIYTKPVNEGTILADNVSALFRHICPYLQGNTDRILLFPDRFMKKQADDSKMFYSLDLPYCTKYLLLAAYMASFIPSKHDRLFFCHRSLKKKKGNSRSASNTKVNTLVGPRAFSVNRLIAIYLAISGERSISAVSLSQVTYLVELRLLVISGNAQYINLDTPKYKCVAPVELINIVANDIIRKKSAD